MKALAITRVWQNGFPTLKADTQSHFAKHPTVIGHLNEIERLKDYTSFYHLPQNLYRLSRH